VNSTLALKSRRVKASERKAKKPNSLLRALALSNDPIVAAWARALSRGRTVQSEGGRP
jgi:hypothetical protein